jgi:hypothetical protein
MRKASTELLEHGIQAEGVTKPAKIGRRKVLGQEYFPLSRAVSSDARLRRLEHLGVHCHLVHSTSVSGYKQSLPS